MEQLQTCISCNCRFQISNEEAALRRKVSPIHAGQTLEFPQPTHCPDCRARRRWAFRNEQHLYRTRCDLCGKGMISVHRNTGRAPIYCYSCWWSDRWDAAAFGRAIDWNRPIFAQVADLMKVVPECGIYGQQNENCDYNSQIAWSKDCYLSFLCYHSQSCLYAYSTMNGKDVVDCFRTQDCEICYEGVYLEKCYRVHFSDHCRNCSDSAFLSRCSGCHHCFFCCNLRNAKYCIFNRQLTQQEYENALQEFSLDSWQGLSKLKAKFESFRLKHPFPATHNESCERSTGDYLRNCEDCHSCFDLTNCRGCMYCVNFWNLTDCLDCVTTQTELGYECMSGGPRYRVAGCVFCLESSNSYYSRNTMNSDSCFACVGMKRAKHCILNRQYSEPEYQELFPRLIEKMRRDGEFGEFFPVSMSPFAYNESMASHYFPLSPEEVRRRGWQWFDDPGQGLSTPAGDRSEPSVPPDLIAAAGADVTEQLYRCEKTGHPFRVIPQELQFLKQERIALPRECPDVRSKRRASSVPARALYSRSCSCRDAEHHHGPHCGQQLTSTYGEERPETVVCEPCFLSSVF